MSERDEILATLRTAMPELKRHWPIKSLSLFGSLARDDATAASDLDLLVEFAQPVPLSAFLALEDRVGELAGRRVDLVSRAALKPFMARSVLRDAVAI
jgi:predicted nucleotidyltransferase